MIKKCPVCNSTKIVNDGVGKMRCRQCGYVLDKNAHLGDFKK